MKRHFILLLPLLISFELLSQSIKIKNSDGIEILSKQLCKDEQIKLFIDNNLGEPKYNWIGPNGFTSTNAEAKVELKGDKTQKYSVSISGIQTSGTATTMATVTSSITIVILEKPEIKEIKSYVENGSLFLRYSNDLIGMTYLWNGPNNLTATTTQKIHEFPSIQVNQFGEFKLKVQSDNSKYCEYTYTIKTDVSDKEKSEKKEVFGLTLNDEDTKVYILKGQVPFKKSDYDGNISEVAPKFPYFNSKFTVVKELENDVVVNFNTFLRGKDKKDFEDYSQKLRAPTGTSTIKINERLMMQKEYKQDEYNNPIFFRISKKELNDLNKARKFYSVGINSLSFTAGTVVLPIKLRYPSEGGKYFDFSKDITLGPFIGMRTRISHYNSFFLNVGVNVGISSVTLDKSNAFIRLESTNDDTENKISPKNSVIEKPVDLAAFTHSFGVIFEYENVQLGLFRGRDRISSTSGYCWTYNNKPWWSIGIGYSILSRPAKRKQNAPNNTEIN